MDLIDRAKLLMQAEHDKTAQQALMVLCANDPVFWFNAFAWTYDPRREPAHQPFNLYPFQEWCIKEWANNIATGQDFGIEKSRDMGVSWMLLLLFQWAWLFKPGWNFLVGSRKESLVETPGDMSTHFPKMRYNLKCLPEWMHPKDFDPRTHDCYMRMINPQNSNSIIGESANAGFGRGGRYKAILYDEFAFFECDEAAWTSGSQSTPCRIAVSTPSGKANAFARLMLDPNNERLEFVA